MPLTKFAIELMFEVACLNEIKMLGNYIVYKKRLASIVHTNDYGVQPALYAELDESWLAKCRHSFSLQRRRGLRRLGTIQTYEFVENYDSVWGELVKKVTNLCLFGWVDDNDAEKSIIFPEVGKDSNSGRGVYTLMKVSRYTTTDILEKMHETESYFDRLGSPDGF